LKPDVIKGNVLENKAVLKYHQKVAKVIITEIEIFCLSPRVKMGEIYHAMFLEFSGLPKAAKVAT